MELDRPEQWSLKGEGNANWVFAYTGTMPHLVGQVLRVSKPKTAAAPVQLELEETVWAPVLGSAAEGSCATQAAAEREHAYVHKGPAVCIELKPKCGFVGGACPTVHPDNRAVKRSASRYQLHQLLKLEQGKIAARSAYDPCDLFSGDPLRLRSALAALLEQPQNNLLLFRDAGKRELAGGQPARAAPQAAAAQHHVAGQGVLQPQQQEGGGAALEELVEGLLPLPASQRRSALVELLAAVLEMEGVLGRVLVAQQQCQHDVEGVYRLYCHLTGAAHAAAHANGSLGSDKQGSDAAALAACDDHAAAVRQLLLLPPEEAHAVLRSYVVATTAKDLAIMITLQQLAGVTEQLQQQRQDASGDLPLGHVYCSAARGWYAYRLTFVDLDLKPLAKIPQHYKLDREIVAAAQRLFTDGLGGSSGRTEHQHQHGVAQQQL